MIWNSFTCKIWYGVVFLEYETMQNICSKHSFYFSGQYFNLSVSQHEARKAEICNCICCILKVIETSASELFQFWEKPKTNIQILDKYKTKECEVLNGKKRQGNDKMHLQFEELECQINIIAINRSCKWHLKGKREAWKEEKTKSNQGARIT